MVASWGLVGSGLHVSGRESILQEWRSLVHDSRGGLVYLGQVWSRLQVSDRSGLHCQEWGGKEVRWIKFGVLYRGWECLRIRGFGYTRRECFI